MMSHQCSECFKPATLCCSICKIRFYCSADCQKIAWKRHKHTCRLHVRNEDYEARYSIPSPINSQFRALSPRWCGKIVSLELAFAFASAFKVIDFYRPSTLPSTHLLILVVKFNKLEKFERDQIEVVDGYLMTREAFFENGFDGEGWSRNSIEIRESLRESLKDDAQREQAALGFTPPTLFPTNPNQPYVRCPVVVIGIAKSPLNRDQYLPCAFEAIPTYNSLPTNRIPFLDHEEFWLEGLKANLNHGGVTSPLDLAFRAMLRSEVRTLKNQHPTDSPRNSKEFVKFPSRLIDKKIIYGRRAPQTTQEYAHPLTWCRSPFCPRSGQIYDNPATRVERELILRNFLIRDFDRLLAIKMINQIEKIVSTYELGSSRIVELLLGGITSKQLCSTSFADSQSSSLVRMIVNRSGVSEDVLARSLEEVVAQEAFELCGPLRAVSHDAKPSEADAEALTRFMDAPGVDEWMFKSARAKIPGLTREDYGQRLIEAKGLYRLPKKGDSLLACSHDLFDLDAVKKLFELPERCLPPLPPLETTTSSSLFKQIQRLISRGDIAGDEWDDSTIWRPTILMALKIFSTSLRSAVSSFVATEATFAAFHRQFLQEFPHLLQFISSFPLALTDTRIFVESGGFMAVDDPIYDERRLEVEKLRNGGGVASGKMRKNARKKEKRAEKLRSVSLEQTKKGLELDGPNKI